ncbi:predicted protein [Aspergillus terreus NIH2624]|uniref:FAD-binding PCMH-type domain-containing protein n=1 Tax=Aspergillus terreus (strain NIH 2624 / FGSC A1156) TaxID=341663 RepID=Q0CUP1_ASPTN|nr:uncharacterized protein ATEG_02593 [Aspergillus terreus NIH2624]EAU37555.1 predicted protein [Aspergillus terreus NIH2624]
MPVAAVLPRLMRALVALNLCFVFGTASLQNDEALPDSLQSCLNATGSSVSYPGSAAYDALNKPQNANYSPQPGAITTPASSEEVSAIVKCVAAEEGRIKLSPRGGGHSYAAYSFSGHVVIDSSNMRDVTFDDETRQVTVQFGQTLGPFAEAMGRKGYALPHGTCPGVGVAGHSLGGGYGYTSRKWGWLVDHIVAMELVDAHGNIKKLNIGSTGTETELWWALRGAGANSFGIVTAFTYAMEMAPAATVNFNLTFANRPDCSQVLLSLQSLEGNATSDEGLPVEWGADLVITGRGPGDTGFCSMDGQFLGTKSEFSGVMDRLLDDLEQRGVRPVEGEVDSREFTDWVEALTDLMGPLDEPSDPHSYYARSLLDDGAPGYTVHDAERIMDAIQAARGVNGTANHVAFNVEGPKSMTNQPPPTGDMSFIHRQSLFIVQIYSDQFPGSERHRRYQGEPARRHVACLSELR